MTRMTLEQKRVQHAWKKAAQGIGADENYVKAAKGLPALIMNSGLMQVMAFCHDKGGRHEMLAGHLRDWLHEQLKTPTGFEGFMREMMQADSRRYQQVTSEAFAWLKWLRQMAAAREGGE